MSNRARRDSRRGLFAPHHTNPLKLRRCPICQWAIDEDHAEALTMSVAPAQPPDPPAEATSDRYEYVPLAVAGFALV
jgi:hypothetical protein